MLMFKRSVCSLTAVFLIGNSLFLFADQKSENPTGDVSYYHQIRPLFQANCQGCHQPAKDKGGYVMTDFKSLLAGGDDEGTAIVPGKVNESAIVEQILPDPETGKAPMPRGKKPLHSAEIELIKKWITQGAKDDTPPGAGQRYTADDPPVYTLPPVITSIDYSPNGKLLAVAGFHEVLLHKADGSGLKARLVGLSERIESVRFSPDGTRLAVTGGKPGRMGELASSFGRVCSLWRAKTPGILAASVSRDSCEENVVHDIRIFANHAAFEAHAGKEDPALTAAQQQALDSLKPLKGAEFDKAYAAAQVDAHQKTLDALKATIGNKDVPQPLRDFATKLIPTVTAHLNLAKGLKA